MGRWVTAQITIQHEYEDDEFEEGRVKEFEDAITALHALLSFSFDMCGAKTWLQNDEEDDDDEDEEETE